MKSQTASRVLLTFALLWSLALPLFAATLVNINTADSATLQTLNGIGPSKAQAIIDYRTQHGAFATIQDIQNVSGIGPSTYANIKDYITVGDGTSAQTTPTQSTQTQTNSQTQQTSQQDQTTQTQTSTNSALPPVITAKITTDAKAVVGAGTILNGSAYNSAGEPLVANVRYMWNFGDGTTAEGQQVIHTYRYPGAYSVELNIGYNYSSAMARLKLPVIQPTINLVAEGDASLTVYNQTADDIDVGGWSIVDPSAGLGTGGTTKTFVIPADTVVLAGEGVRFGAAATGLPGSRSAMLLYPNGTQAASAVVGKSSPLRGERITPAPIAPATVSAPAQPAVIPTTTPNMAAAATAPASGQPMSWFPFGGLVALLAVGGAGAWYAGALPKRRPETPDSPDEFDIE
ncbi:MAG TPA: helix-hairpin-helix domain-containing protein [Candidatus Paceibacterota bacterium]